MHYTTCEISHSHSNRPARFGLCGTYSWMSASCTSILFAISVSTCIHTHTHTHTHTPHTQRNAPTNKQAFVEVLLDLFSLTRPPPPSGDVAKVARAIQKAWNDASPHANLVRRISSLFKDCLTKHGYTKEKTQWVGTPASTKDDVLNSFDHLLKEKYNPPGLERLTLDLYSDIVKKATQIG